MDGSRTPITASAECHTAKELNLDEKVARKLQEVEEMLQRLGQTSWSDQGGEFGQGAGMIEPRSVELSENYGSSLVNSPPTDHDQTGGGVNAGDETSIRMSIAGVQPARDGLLSTESASKITGGLRVPPGFESSISPGFQSRDAYRGSLGKKVHFSSTPVIDRPETLHHQTLGFDEEFLELPPSLGNLGKWRVGQPRTEATNPQVLNGQEHFAGSYIGDRVDCNRGGLPRSVATSVPLPPRERGKLDSRFRGMPHAEAAPCIFPQNSGYGENWDVGGEGRLRSAATNPPVGMHTKKNRPSQRPCMLPDKFDGVSSWKDYLCHFKDVAEINGWDDREKARYLRASMTSEARRVLSQLPAGVESVYAVVVETLEEHFGHKRQAPLLRTQLRSYSRKKGETVMQLGVSIQRLVDARYPTVDSVTSQILALDHFKTALNDKAMEDFLFLGRPKDLKEAVGLAAEFEANRTARLQRQATAVKDQRGVRTTTEKEFSKPNFRQTKPGKRQWTEPVGRGEVQGSYIERPAEQVSGDLADKRDMGDRDQICVTPAGPTALTEAERKGRNSDAPVVARKHESGAESPMDSGRGGRDPYGVAHSKPVDVGSRTGGNNMAGCSMVAVEKLEQVDDCCNKSLHSKSNVSGERACGKLPQTTPQDTQHETMGRSCKESPDEVGRRPRVGTVRKGRLVSVYLEGNIQENTVKFLVDSGSSMSFLSRKKYLELVPDKGEDLKPTEVPHQLADESPLEVLGQVELVVKLEGRPLIVEFQVAELELKGILGLDFLHSHRCQWDWDNCSMVVAGVAVPLITGMKYDDPIVSKVQAKDNFVVPAGHEMLVFGEVPETQLSGRVAEIRPKGKFVERTGLLVARALVKPGSSRVPIRLMNPGTEDVKVWKKTCMAEVHKLDEADDILGTISPHQEKDDPVEDVRPKERRAIPPHLIDLYNRSTFGVATPRCTEKFGGALRLALFGVGDNAGLFDSDENSGADLLVKDSAEDLGELDVEDFEDNEKFRDQLYSPYPTDSRLEGW
ncbi:hypothetical protein HOLleu_40984 [Holothuria leucospilota]|uniref:Peptidase A2 domain-containing protein n=1 Tax=Holothuria leucospilota TaxID=206669 RepID=A0A9Q0YBZ7_HOLLE|nr:hypothetical protein HOLleu_40984 [Holothuria leucospilota]